MSKRVKPILAVPTISNLEEADSLLGEIAARKRRIDQINLNFKAQVDAMKKTAAAQCEPILQEIDVMEQTLVRFGEARKSELFGKKKSIGLNFGVIGFRSSTALKTMRKTTWEQVLGLLKTSSDEELSACVRIKQEVDKDALRQLSSEKLALAGCRLEQTDAFYYEISEPELNEKAGGEQ